MFSASQGLDDSSDVLHCKSTPNAWNDTNQKYDVGTMSLNRYKPNSQVPLSIRSETKSCRISYRKLTVNDIRKMVF